MEVGGEGMEVGGEEDYTPLEYRYTVTTTVTPDGHR